MLTSPPRSFFHHFASQGFQARTLEKKKNLPRDAHVSKRNSRVFRRPEDSRSVNFPVKKLVSSIPPSPRPEITRVDRSVARQRRKNRFLPKKWTAWKWTTPLGIRDVSRWIVWEMKEKKNLNISSIISVSTRMENRWSGICCLTKNVGKMFWKFQNGKRWMRMMKLTMEKKNSEFF